MANNLQEGAEPGPGIGRTYLEISVRANISLFLSGFTSFAIGRERSEEAIELAESCQMENRSVVGPALVAIGGNMVCMGEFDGARHWAERRGDGTRRRRDPALPSTSTPRWNAPRSRRRSFGGAGRASARREEPGPVDGEHVLAGMRAVEGWRHRGSSRQSTRRRASLAQLLKTT